jgi:hypothetical protein
LAILGYGGDKKMYKYGYEVSYIGDGVYAYFDGYQVWIYTSNGRYESEPTALNDNTMIALIEYAKNRFSKGVIK